MLTLVLVIVLVTPYTCVTLPVVLVLLIVMRRKLLPLVMFDEQISLLEETTSPVSQVTKMKLYDIGDFTYLS